MFKVVPCTLHLCLLQLPSLSDVSGNCVFACVTHLECTHCFCAVLLGGDMPSSWTVHYCCPICDTSGVRGHPSMSHLVCNDSD